jgi:hypothetical protein
MIRKSENNLSGVSRWKNETWELSGRTPNEAYLEDVNYQKYVDGFASHNGLGASRIHKFFEVRIVSDTPSIIFSVTKSQMWYRAPFIMDRVFWMFQKPIEGRIDNAPYTYYVLEPLECVRVTQLFHQYTGQNLADGLNAFVVPTECCQIAWTETSAGVSDHLHWRPEIVKTQEQIDKEEHLNAETQKILDTAFDVDPDTINAFVKSNDKH